MRASLWNLVKLISILPGACGEARMFGLPSRQKVRSVRYRPRNGTAGGVVLRSRVRYSW